MHNSQISTFDHLFYWQVRPPPAPVFGMQVPVQQVVSAEQALAVQQVLLVVEQVSLLCWQVSLAVQAAPLAI